MKNKMKLLSRRETLSILGVVGMVAAHPMIAQASTEDMSALINEITKAAILDSIKNPKWHIGWNNIDVEENSCLKKFDKYELYFNHSFTYKCSPEFIQATSNVGNNNSNNAIFAISTCDGFVSTPTI